MAVKTEFKGQSVLKGFYSCNCYSTSKYVNFELQLLHSVLRCLMPRVVGKKIRVLAASDLSSSTHGSIAPPLGYK